MSKKEADISHRYASWGEEVVEGAMGEALEAALACLGDLCRGHRTWTMHIPAREDDPDVIIGNALHCAKDMARRVNSGSCTNVSPERPGDCEHAVGLPGHSIPGQHDGPDDTVDAWGKPNGWCWSCWKSYMLQQSKTQVEEGRRLVRELEKALAQERIDKVEGWNIAKARLEHEQAEMKRADKAKKERDALIQRLADSDKKA